MYKSSPAQDQIVLVDTATVTGTGAAVWAKTGLAYIELSGVGQISWAHSGTYSGTFQFQSSNNLITWTSMAMQLDSSTMPVNENTQQAGSSTGTWSVPTRGQRYIRCNCSAYTSGTLTITVTGRSGSAITTTIQSKVEGNVTNNSAAPLTTGNLGTLPAVANAANPSYTETYEVKASVDLTGHMRVAPGAYPAGATAITAASGNVANATAAATLAGAASKTTYITGFEITAAGATVGAAVTATVTGTISGTLSYTFTAPAGSVLNATPLLVAFPIAIPASATNTAIVVSLPALGAGNVNATTVAHGYQL